MDSFRDSFAGHLIRVASGRRLLQYPEERDHTRWKAFIRDNKALETVDTSSDVWLSTLVSQTITREKTRGGSSKSDEDDVEKSKDTTIITWADDNDQGVSVSPEILIGLVVDLWFRIRRIGACSKSSSSAD